MKKILLLTLCLGSISIYAQDNLKSNTYFRDLNIYNPAAGLNYEDASKEVNLYTKSKFVGNDKEIWSKNSNLYLNHLGKVGEKGFYSLSYLNDDYSFYNRNAVSMGYTYIKKGENATLSVGGRLNLNFDKMQWDEFAIGKPADAKSSYLNPDFDLGAQYKMTRLTAGFGIRNLFGKSTKIEGEKLLENKREAYLTASYRLGAESTFALTPYTMISMGRKTSIDLGANVTMADKVDLGYHFKLDGLRNVFIARAFVTPKINVVAAYDFSFTHTDHNLELGVGYRF